MTLAHSTVASNASALFAEVAQPRPLQLSQVHEDDWRVLDPRQEPAADSSEPRPEIGRERKR